MKAKITARPFLGIALVSVVAWLCVYPTSKDAKSSVNESPATSEDAKVDLDFTCMNPTMKMTYTYRLGASPKEFEGKALRISGIFLTRVDNEDGKRYFGCFMGDPGGCSCCAPGGVLEFIPKDCYIWPTNFPSAESGVTVTGRLKMFDIVSQGQSLTIPRLVDADIFWESK